MFWLLDDKIEENYIFAQIFATELMELDGNTIYNLTSEPDTKKIKEITPKTYSFTIKVSGQLISWTNLETGKTLTFSKKENVIDPKENPNGYLIFNYNYKLVDSHRLPMLKTNLYDYYCENICMEVYIINPQTLFVHEINKSNNSERKYFVVKNYSGFKM